MILASISARVSEHRFQYHGQALLNCHGLADVTSIQGYADSMLTDPNRITASEMMNWAGPPLFSAGSSWDYCNTNYLLAGLDRRKCDRPELWAIVAGQHFGPSSA